MFAGGFGGGVVALGLLGMMCSALAQVQTGKSPATYPEKPIRMIVPNPPGGGVDIIARLIGHHLGEKLRQPIVIDNRAGAGGTIGLSALAKSPADGYTLGMGVTATLSIAPALYRNLPYDAQKDFDPVVLIAKVPLILAVHPSLPVKSVQDLITLARQRPAQIGYSSGGNGTPPHLAGELFKTLAKIDILHVPYKGGPPAINALIAGEVSLMFANALPALPHIKSGRLKALAVTSERRASAFPDLPSISEAGIRAYSAVQWYGVLAPAGTPQAIVERLNREIRDVLRIGEVRAPLLAEGAELADGTPGQFRAFIRDEASKWETVAKQSGAQLD
jgi:tripartite-type tricarboxylate transporter receptor subunit TctC